MRIAIFTNAYKPIASGVVNTIDFIVNALREKGNDVCIFAPGFKDYKDADERVYRYRSVNLTRDVKFPIAIPFSFKIGKILDQFKPDIIHVHQPFVLGDAAYYYSRKFNIPIVFTLHTQYEMYSHYVPLPPDIVKYLCRHIVKRFAEKTDLVTTPAESIAGLLRNYGVQNRIKVIPNAIDIDSYREISRDSINDMKDELGLGKNKVILYVGRIAPEKNLELLVDAFETVCRYKEGVKLLMVGDGTFLQQLKSYTSSKGLDGSVIFTGNVDYKKIPVFYLLSDIFAITSTSEVKPLVILEALAANIPVVAVNAPGAMDTLTDGFDSILTKECIGEFSDALIKLLENEVFYKKLKTGTHVTASKYSIRSVSNDILNMYQDIINERASII